MLLTTRSSFLLYFDALYLLTYLLTLDGQPYFHAACWTIRETFTASEGRRAFSVAGSTVWNSLPDKLRDPSLSIDSFRRQYKTFLFAD